MKTKAELMRRVRKERRDQGLVELRVWLSPVDREKVNKFIKGL